MMRSSPPFFIWKFLNLFRNITEPIYEALSLPDNFSPADYKLTFMLTAHQFNFSFLNKVLIIGNQG